MFTVCVGMFPSRARSGRGAFKRTAHAQKIFLVGLAIVEDFTATGVVVWYQMFMATTIPQSPRTVNAYRYLREIILEYIHLTSRYIS